MPDQVLQDIKDRLNIADIIAGYIPIKKAGKMYIYKRSFALLSPLKLGKSGSG
jgi:DNA primase